MYPPPPFHFERVDNSLSLSTQALALNNASRYKEKWGKEKAAKGNTWSGTCVAAPGKTLSCLSTWTLNPGRWSLGAPCSWQRPRESKIRKYVQEWRLKARNGTETYNKSCKLRRPGRQCQNLKCAVCETTRSGGDCGKYKDTFIAQFLLTVDLRFLGLQIFLCFKIKLEIWISLWHFAVFRKLSVVWFWYRTNKICLLASVLCRQLWSGVNFPSEKYTCKVWMQWAI